MRRRLNYTGRKRIKREHFMAKVVGDDGLVVSMHLDCSQTEFPDNAIVIAEPHIGTVSQRINLGTIAKLDTSANHDLSSLGSPEKIIFDVKVVSEDGLILGSGTGIPLTGRGESGGSRSLLPVRKSLELGNEIWKLRSLEDAEPCLLINGKVSGLLDRLVSDPLIQGAILVPAVRMIVTYLLEDGTPESVPWQGHWATWFATAMEGKSLEDAMSEADSDTFAIQRFADEAAISFADQFGFADSLEQAE